MIKMNILTPGFFGKTVAADNRRGEFDYKNESLMMSETDIDYLFIGDSITHFWELSAYFDTTHHVFINRGIGGDVTEYVLKRFEADCLQLKPRVAILLIGTNDLWALEPDGWAGTAGGDKELVKKSLLANYRDLLQRAKDAKQQLVVCSILPTNMTFIQLPHLRNEVIVEVNESLKQLCEAFDCLYVDYHTHMVKEDGLTARDGLMKEGLHPIYSGYQLMSDILRTELLEKGLEI